MQVKRLKILNEHKSIVFHMVIGAVKGKVIIPRIVVGRIAKEPNNVLTQTAVPRLYT